MPVFYSKSKKKAFTLIELLIVLAIIGALSGILITAINPAKQFAKARDATRKKDLAIISAGLEQMYSMINRYPAYDGPDLSSSEECKSLGTVDCSIECLKTALISGNIDCDKSTPENIAGVIRTVPEDPRKDEGLNYCYKTDPSGQNYSICAWQETALADEGIDVITCIPPAPLSLDTTSRKIYCVTNPF